MRQGITTAVVAAAVALALPAQAAFAADLPTTVQVSLTAAGGQSGGWSSGGSLSADGRLSAFEVRWDDVVPGDSNGFTDLVLHDEVTGATTRIGTALDGQQPNGGSSKPKLSADGKWVAFASLATNFVVGDTNNATDVFLFEVATGATTRVSVTNKGEEGKFGGYNPSISADGRYVAFESSSHLAGPGADLNGAADAFVYDRVKRTTIRASVSSSGDGVNKAVTEVQISGDGHAVVFTSKASNLAPDDTNGAKDVFVRDLVARTTTMVSATPTGAAGDGPSYWPAIDGSGRHVVLVTAASDLTPEDINGHVETTIVFDLVTGERTTIPQRNHRIWGLSISADGQVIGFAAVQDKLVPGDTNEVEDGFVFHVGTRLIERVTLGVDGAQLDKVSNGVTLSADGRSAIFDTSATNVVPANPSGKGNVYVRHFG